MEHILYVSASLLRWHGVVVVLHSRGTWEGRVGRSLLYFISFFGGWVWDTAGSVYFLFRHQPQMQN